MYVLEKLNQEDTTPTCEKKLKQKETEKKGKWDLLVQRRMGGGGNL